MTYYESAEGYTLNLEQVRQLLKRHGLGEEDLRELIADLGSREEYNAQTVLRWLGY